MNTPAAEAAVGAAAEAEAAAAAAVKVAAEAAAEAVRRQFFFAFFLSLTRLSASLPGEQHACGSHFLSPFLLPTPPLPLPHLLPL